MNFCDALQSFDDSLTPEERKAKFPPKKPKKEANKKTQKIKKKNDPDIERKKNIYNVIKTGNLQEFKEMFNIFKDEDKERQFVNELLDEHKNCPLHIAAIHEQTDIILFLLENHADPCLKNDKQFTPYTAVQTKEVRDVFKDYAQRNPEKYNYNKVIKFVINYQSL